MRLYALVRLTIEGGAGATLIVEPGAAFEVNDDALVRELVRDERASYEPTYRRTALRKPERHRQMRVG